MIIFYSKVFQSLNSKHMLQTPPKFTCKITRKRRVITCSPGSAFVLKRAFARFFKGLVEDAKLYKRLDPSVKSPLVLFLHAGYHSMILYRLARLFYDLKMYPVSFLIYYLNRILFSVDIHPRADIEPGVVIDHGVGVVIGSTATVGSGTLIYHGVTLGARRVQTGKRHPDIGRNVLIGAGAKVLGPIRVGDGARIGANAVVLRDVPPGAVAVGIPATIRRSNVPDPSVHLHGEDSVESMDSLDLESGENVGTGRYTD